MEFASARQQIVTIAQALVAKGHLMATGGNISQRISGRAAFAITPSNYDYMLMTPEDVCVLDFGLQRLAGERKPSIESAMHAAVYQARPDVNAILHTHQVHASALTVINAPIPALYDEQVLFLGPGVDIIPYAPSGTLELRNMVAAHVRDHNNAYLMQNHGALVFGSDLLRAVHNVEVLEKCAEAYLLALRSGRPIREIPPVSQAEFFVRLLVEQAQLR
jgi:ribulose-5-phosphate 4-epimerase/fuculose-1-phosphate aldolase